MLIIRKSYTNKYMCGKEKAFYYAIVTLFRIVLDLTYKDVVSTFFAYTGFKNEITQKDYFISWILLFLFAKIVWVFYQNKDERVSCEVLYFLFLLSVVPFSSMLGFGAINSSFGIAFSSYFMILYILCKYIGLKPKYRFFILSETPKGDILLKIVAIFFAMTVLFISARYSHFRISLSFSNVYQLRKEASSYSLPTMLVYAFSWVRTVNSILIAYFIRKKQFIWAIAAIFIQLLCFSIDGLKGTLFLLLVAIVISILPNLNGIAINRLALEGVTGLMGVSYCFYKITGNFALVSLLTRRVMYVPIGISSYYYDFFSNNTPDFFRQSFMRLFGLQSPYPTITYHISQMYEGTASNANNGLLADAMTNLGYIGILVFPIALCIVLCILDISSEKLDPRLYITVSVYVAIELTNTFLLRLLFTHGLIITIICLRLMSRDKQISIKQARSMG